MHKVIIVGGGAAGMIAAIFAEKNGNDVLLLEKNEKLGKKIYITGKGRCNLTNDVSAREFFDFVVNNPKFLYGAINAFPPQAVKDFFEENGLRLKTERGNRVFPASDKASDVTKTLEKVMRETGVSVRLDTEVKAIITKDGKVTAVKTDKGTEYCDSVVVCTGGMSYPLTGSTGDGYVFAKAAGHTIVKPRASLVGIELKDNDIYDLQGLSLKNVSIKAVSDGKTVYEDFGEMLFTHYGISGPIVLSCSCLLNELDLKKVKLVLDLKPALDEKTLDNRLIREIDSAKGKEIKTVARSLAPSSLVPFILKRAKIHPDKKCGELTREERRKLVSVFKNVELWPRELRPLSEAIITAGGVNVKEINPKTMESKIITGLFFAGEVLDVDCFTGGFNLQTAFATGFIAGKNA